MFVSLILHSDNFIITICKRQGYYFTPFPLLISLVTGLIGLALTHESCNDGMYAVNFLLDALDFWSEACKISVAFNRQKRALAGRLSERSFASSSSLVSGLALSAWMVICSLSWFPSAAFPVLERSFSVALSSSRATN